ncbi:TPA: hypothetical protein MYP09_001372 [Citrobacter farmeri]|nr:hypothetical protein [Citrobacter farmeri]
MFAQPTAEQMQAIQQMNQEALGDSYITFNGLIQKQLFGQMLTTEEAKQLKGFQTKIQAHRQEKEKEPRKQEFIGMVANMKTLGFTTADLKALCAGTEVATTAAKDKIVFTLGTYKLKDFNSKGYFDGKDSNGKPVAVKDETFTVTVGDLPRGQGWKAEFMSDFREAKNLDKVINGIDANVKTQIIADWEPKGRGTGVIFHSIRELAKVLKVKEEVIKAKLQVKEPTDKEIEAKKKALEDAKKVAVEEALA